MYEWSQALVSPSPSSTEANQPNHEGVQKSLRDSKLNSRDKMVSVGYKDKA
jgi:hypothetical protein